LREQQEHERFKPELGGTARRDDRGGVGSCPIDASFRGRTLCGWKQRG
jgi:hypothetical protein